MTLEALRKVGGFTELEHAQRAHPSLLLDIIETMAIAKSDPANADLKSRAKQENARDLNDLVIESAPIREARARLDALLATIARASEDVAQATMGLNFILARSGHLCAVRAMQGAATPRKTLRNPPANEQFRATLILMRDYYVQTCATLERTQNLLASAATSCNTRATPRDLARTVEPPCARASAIAQLPPVDNGAQPVDTYIARSILVARVALIFEEYLAGLIARAKKSKQYLDLAFAQCAVLMSNRAMIAK
jgi:hypothetical protein